MFNNSMVASLSALILVATSAFALADSKDRPVSPQGAGVEIAPSDDALITPMKGTGLVSTEELAMRGAKAAAPANFPATSLDTVARGKVGAVESVINWDSRTRGYTVDYPNRAIVFIEYNGDHLCTGYMYAPNMVATAGHCVHTGGSSGAWRTKSLYKVYAGRDGTASPYGFCTVARLNSVLGWTRDGDFHYDYAAMRLNCTIGNTVGWFGMYTPSGGMNQPAIIAGYPGDKPRTLWTSADKIRPSVQP